jgi:hypothetical protein
MGLTHTARLDMLNNTFAEIRPKRSHQLAERPALAVSRQQTGFRAA